MLAALNLANLVPMLAALRSETTAAPFQRGWVQMQETADFLRDHARPGERFISTSDFRQISYLSGVPSLPLGAKRIESCSFQADDFDLWRDAGVAFAIISTDHVRSCFHHVLTSEYLKNRGFKRVMRNPMYQVFYKPLSGSRASGIANRAKGGASHESMARPISKPSSTTIK